MARGFESKDVEYQQAEAQRKGSPGKTFTPAEREAMVKRQSLDLALARLRADLAAARNPAHRHMLTQAIADLERQRDG